MIGSKQIVLGKLIINDAGNFGSFIGGVIGSIWSLAGVIFF